MAKWGLVLIFPEFGLIVKVYIIFCYPAQNQCLEKIRFLRRDKMLSANQIDRLQNLSLEQNDEIARFLACW